MVTQHEADKLIQGIGTKLFSDMSNSLSFNIGDFIYALVDGDNLPCTVQKIHGDTLTVDDGLEQFDVKADACELQSESE